MAERFETEGNLKIQNVKIDNSAILVSKKEKGHKMLPPEGPGGVLQKRVLVTVPQRLEARPKFR